jgi:hypothetical protein
MRADAAHEVGLLGIEFGPDLAIPATGDVHDAPGTAYNRCIRRQADGLAPVSRVKRWQKLAGER